jgi:hypothetical protein
MGIRSSEPTDSEHRWFPVSSTGGQTAQSGSLTVKTGGTSGRRTPRKRLSGPPPPPEDTGDTQEPWRSLPLFAYGSLTFREVLEERIRHRWDGRYEPAALVGWRIEPGWPRHAVVEPDGIAHGFRLTNLSEEDIRIIDRYEGCHNGVYRRVVVTLDDGTEAYFYATGPAGHRRLQRRANGTEPTRRPFISGQKVSV